MYLKKCYIMAAPHYSSPLHLLMLSFSQLLALVPTVTARPLPSRR